MPFVAKALVARRTEIGGKTIHRERGYRFFFSREESRMHVHLICADGESKSWLDPAIEMARSFGISDQQLW